MSKQDDNGLKRNIKDPKDLEKGKELLGRLKLSPLPPGLCPKDFETAKSTKEFAFLEPLTFGTHQGVPERKNYSYFESGPAISKANRHMNSKDKRTPSAADGLASGPDKPRSKEDPLSRSHQPFHSSYDGNRKEFSGRRGQGRQGPSKYNRGKFSSQNNNGKEVGSGEKKDVESSTGGHHFKPKQGRGRGGSRHSSRGGRGRSRREYYEPDTDWDELFSDCSSMQGDFEANGSVNDGPISSQSSVAGDTESCGPTLELEPSQDAVNLDKIFERVFNNHLDSHSSQSESTITKVDDVHNNGEAKAGGIEELVNLEVPKGVNISANSELDESKSTLPKGNSGDAKLGVDQQPTKLEVPEAVDNAALQKEALLPEGSVGDVVASSSNSKSKIASEVVPDHSNEGVSELQRFMQQFRDEKQKEIILQHSESPEVKLQKRIQAIAEHQKSLPIFASKEKLIKMVSENQISIVKGETGCGKSTQLAQYLIEAGFGKNGKIGITQPRRIAAISLAERVAEELGRAGKFVKVGGLVGYAVRFDQRVSKSTMIKYMTDGFLVKEANNDPDFKEYSVIIIDEAHERSLHTDVCLGLLKRLAKRRPDLKIIVSSATLDHEALKTFFEITDNQVCHVLGNCHPVKQIFVPENVLLSKNYKEDVIRVVLHIHRNEPKGDILVFLPGKEEIDYVQNILTGEYPNDLLVVPVHSNMPLEDQRKIYDIPADSQRKIVLATNIAETSITIDGIVYVVDPGYYKHKVYNPQTGINALVEQRITKFHAIQRRGRAGRTCPGKCYHLYTEKHFEDFELAPEPEIKRSNLSSVMLDLLSMGVSPLEFEFMDKPSPKSLFEAIEHLIELSALDNRCQLTDLGKKMASLPVDPPLARVMIDSVDRGCWKEVVIIVAMLSCQYHNIFIRTDPNRKKVDSAMAKFYHPEGDHLTLLNIYNSWAKTSSAERNKWCRFHCIDSRHLEEADSIRKQLTEILKGFKEIEPKLKPTPEVDRKKLSENIRKAFTTGYFRQIARKVGGVPFNKFEPITTSFYAPSSSGEPLRDRFVRIHSTSSLALDQKKLNWVIFHEVGRNKEKMPCMRGVSIIDPTWFKECAGAFSEKYEKYRKIAKEAQHSTSSTDQQGSLPNI